MDRRWFLKMIAAVASSVGLPLSISGQPVTDEVIEALPESEATVLESPENPTFRVEFRWEHGPAHVVRRPPEWRMRITKDADGDDDYTWKKIRGGMRDTGTYQVSLLALRPDGSMAGRYSSLHFNSKYRDEKYIQTSVRRFFDNWRGWK